MMLFVTALLIVGGCGDPPTKVPGTSSQPTFRPAGQAVLKAVDLQSGVYLARHEVHTTITPEGVLRSVRTENKSYGPRDIDPKQERIQIRAGRLTPAQMSELAGLFAGWESLSREPYGGVPDGAEIRIQYGDKTVAGGSAAPKQIWMINARVSELAGTMPVVEK